jgi:hypothetical protein
MKVLEISITVGKVASKHVYVFKVHPNNPDNLMLPKSFYEKFGKIPTDTQFEVEVTTWFSPKFEGLIHTHKSADGKNTMMCYPLLIPSSGVALEKIIVWSIGTAYTEESGEDFQTIFKGDVLDFLETMDKIHHIKLSSIQFD